MNNDRDKPDPFQELRNHTERLEGFINSFKLVGSDISGDIKSGFAYNPDSGSDQEAPTSGGGGHGDAKTEERQETPTPMLDELTERAKNAISTIENFRIVGPNVSGGGGQWMINP
jgi:hypothetical protein